MKAKKLFVTVTALLLACSVCLFALTACSEDDSYEDAHITDISFSDDFVTMVEGERTDLKPAVTLSNGAEYTNLYGGLVWESSNEKVLKLYHGGIFDAISYGDAVVTCSSLENPSISASVNVRVNRDDTLRVGVKSDVYKFGYVNNFMEAEGLEIDLADRIGYELYFDKVEYVSLDASEREDALSKGLEEREEEKAALEEEEAKKAADAGDDGDDEDKTLEQSEDSEEKKKREGVDCVIATYSVTAERQNLVRFSSTYYTDYVQVMVRRDFANKFSGDYGNTLEGMFEYLTNDEGLSDEERTFVVGTVNGTTAYQSFNSEVSSIGNRFNENGESVRIEPNYHAAEEEEEGYYDSYANVANDLLAGKIDGFCGDHSILSGYMTSATVFLDDAFSPQEYAVGTAIDSGFTAPINNLIDTWLTVPEEEYGGMTFIAYLLNLYEIETFEAEA